ncbi:MAG: ABC transporter ATP-binding protein [Roseiflexaceae bacterium]|nr:ABC transporter ATP-binding protein [Roseiflexaceae bacterium]
MWRACIRAERREEKALSESIAVELRDIVKRFGEVYAVDHVSAQIRDGEFFSMLGPSGCGKTTTLRMIAGFDYPTSGEILLHGQSIGATPPHQRNVNTVFQSYALFPHMTVAQNVAFGLEMKKIARAEVERRVREQLEVVRLPGYGDRYPRQLSGGQQQRVALARALINQPEVLLLDEPLGALDEQLRKELQFELRGLQERLGITFIFVTHDQEEALTMSDRIAVMNAGKMLQVASPTVIYERPNSRFVADFIGEANFLEGTVVESTGELAAVRTANGLTMRAETNGLLRQGQQVTVSIRPEKAYLTTEQPSRDTNVFPVQVNRVAYIGSDTRIVVTLGEGQRFDVWEANDRSTLDRNAYWQPGEQGWLWWPEDNALVLTE